MIFVEFYIRNATEMIFLHKSANFSYLHDQVFGATAILRLLLQANKFGLRDP
jgi:hypothetical protein